MDTLKNKIINDIIEIEGGYVNDPNDSGGETNFGITIDVARRYGYNGPMRDLPRALAFTIYSDEYWYKPRLDEIALMSPEIAEELADTGINMGVGRAGKFLQRSLNVLNNRQKYYNDIVVDGAIGNGTIGALRAYLDKRGKRGEKVLYRMLNSLQGAFYVTLAERREKDESFVYGWYENRVD